MYETSYFDAFATMVDVSLWVRKLQNYEDPLYNLTESTIYEMINRFDKIEKDELWEHKFICFKQKIDLHARDKDQFEVVLNFIPKYKKMKDFILNENIYFFNNYSKNSYLFIDYMYLGREMLTILQKLEAEKEYNDLYQEFCSSIVLPKEFIEYQYSSKYAKFFYTDGELNGFIHKWTSFI